MTQSVGIQQTQTLILGGGAAGMMAAAQAGPETIVIDHAKAPGEKIRISGGGRCNFTNMYCEPKNYLGENPHYHKSALSRFTQWDFIEMVNRHGIAWHEKTLGQLFCDDKATQIVQMLRDEMARAGAQLWLRTSLKSLRHADGWFHAQVEREGRVQQISARNLILATGGKSIPKMGASGLAYDIAQQFDHALTDTRPALVPFTFDKGRFVDLAGIATDVRAQAGSTAFDEAMLFTHRGLSGPAMLQISSYWREGEEIIIDLLAQKDLEGALKTTRQSAGRVSLSKAMGQHLPARLVSFLAQDLDLNGNVADLSDKRIGALCDALRQWRLKPTGTEGYRTAEVTLGGVATSGLDSKTMMSKHLPGLYVIGEAADVTGWLGGYNFQWAWASGWVAGRDARTRSA